MMEADVFCYSIENSAFHFTAQMSEVTAVRILPRVTGGDGEGARSPRPDAPSSAITMQSSNSIGCAMRGQGSDGFLSGCLLWELSHHILRKPNLH